MRLRPTLLFLAVASAPLSAQPQNDLWSPEFTGSTRQLTRVDPAGERLASVPLSVTPFGIARDQFGNLWVGSNGTTVDKLDAAGNVLGTFPVGSFPQSTAADNAGNVWVTNRSSNTVTKLDQVGNVLATVPLPSGTAPIGIIADRGGHVWVSGFHTSTATQHQLFKLDLAGNVVNTFTFSASSGFGFSFPAIDNDNDVWVANQGRNSVMQIDQAGNLVSETPSSSGLPRGCQVDGLNFVWLARQGFVGGVSKIDQAGTVLQTFPAPPNRSFTTCAIDGYGDPWVFGLSTTTAQASAYKLWQVDASQLVEVPLAVGHSAWGGDAGAFHVSKHLQPNADSDNDGFPNDVEINLGSNPLDARSTAARPLPIQSGLPVPGNTVAFGVRYRPDAGRIFALGLALGSSPGITLPDNRNIPLNPDALLILSLSLPGFTGVLNATGDALVLLPLPGNPTLRGLQVVAAFLTLDPGAPSGIQTISNALPLTVR